MQVTLDKQYPVAGSPQAAWRVLSDIQELATCMPGAQLTEQVDGTHYKGSVKVKVGPANAAFAGDIEVVSVDAATRTLRMIGRGADKGGSSASMDLTATVAPAEGEGSTLVGKAEVIVNGKFAQFGSRMLMPVSDMVLGQFAQTFSAKARAVQASLDAAQAGATAPPDGAPAAARVEMPAAPKELNGLALLWAAMRGFFASLFGKKA